MSCPAGRALASIHPPEHSGPAHRCPSCLAISAAGRAAPGERARASLQSLLDRSPAIRAAKPHPCRPLTSGQRAGGRGQRRSPLDLNNVGNMRPRKALCLLSWPMRPSIQIRTSPILGQDPDLGLRTERQAIQFHLPGCS